MSDATDAIADIQEALDEYGSAITLQIITKGALDLDTGRKAETIVEHNIQALPGTYGKDEQNENVHPKDIKFRFYFDSEIGYEDRIIFQGETYGIEQIDKKILQNENLIYTIQGRK